jgi:hypothetical protein
MPASAPEEKQIRCEKLLATIFSAAAHHRRQLPASCRSWPETTTGCEKLLATFCLEFPPKRPGEFGGKNQQGAKTIQQPFATPPMDPDLDIQCKKIE